MIELRSIVVTYGAGTAESKTVLDKVSLSIAPGEFLTVIGSNGAGKSTLLSLLAGEVVASSGDLLIDSLRVNGQSEPERAALISRVFQDPMAGTCAGLSIEENLALASKRGRIRGLRFAVDKAAMRRFSEQLERLGLGLEHRLKDRVGLLSGGQRQAVSLMMAALAPSRLLLLDEHTAALDPATSDLIMRLTSEIVAGAALTTLMVTHSMRQALDYGSRTIMLHSGKIVLDVAGAERSGMGTDGLLRRFGTVARVEATELEFA